MRYGARYGALLASSVTTSTKTFTADAIIINAGTKSFTADAIVFATGTKTFTADAVVSAQSSKTFTADAVVNGTSYTTTATRAVTAGPTLVVAGGTVGTSSAHRAFPVVRRMANGSLLMAYRRATSHGSFDGVLVTKTSSDGGATWGSETLVLSNAAKDYRQCGMRVLASGRVVMTVYYRTTFPKFYTEFVYSDDHGATWTNAGAVTNTGHDPDVAVGDDLLELANGDLLLFSYGRASLAATVWDLRVSKSTNGGTSWSALALIAAGATYSFNVVEPQAAILPDGSTLYCTFHTEDGLPTDIYYTTSTDSGATWATPTLLHDEEAYNRNGVMVSPDGDVIDTYYASATISIVLRQSHTSGVSYGSRIAVQSPPSGKTSPVWASPAQIGNRWASPNVGVATAWETSGQDQADVYFTRVSNGAAWSYNQRTATVTADALIVSSSPTTSTKTFTADAKIVATSTKTFTADAIVATGSVPVAHTTIRDTYASLQPYGGTTSATFTATTTAATFDTETDLPT